MPIDLGWFYFVTFGALFFALVLYGKKKKGRLNIAANQSNAFDL